METPRKITNARKSRKYPDIFYETPKDAAERTDAEREARLAAESRAEAAEARVQASEARERELLAEIERLRAQQAGQ